MISCWAGWRRSCGQTCSPATGLQYLSALSNLTFSVFGTEAGHALILRTPQGFCSLWFTQFQGSSCGTWREKRLKMESLPWVPLHTQLYLHRFVFHLKQRARVYPFWKMLACSWDNVLLAWALPHSDCCSSFRLGTFAECRCKLLRTEETHAHVRAVSKHVTLSITFLPPHSLTLLHTLDAQHINASTYLHLLAKSAYGKLWLHFNCLFLK